VEHHHQSRRDKSETTAKTIHNIGVVNEELGLFDDAFQYYEDAMRMQMEISIAETLHELATTLSEGGKLDEAASNYEAALSIYEKRLGENTRLLVHASLSSYLR